MAQAVEKKIALEEGVAIEVLIEKVHELKEVKKINNKKYYHRYRKCGNSHEHGLTSLFSLWSMTYFFLLVMFINTYNIPTSDNFFI